MKFTLPISPTYVAHWGLWEAVREIYQNALDAHAEDTDCVSTISYDSGTVTIQTSKGKLSPATLLLGNTSKSKNPELRGKFGEGYKLALLVLARLGFRVAVYNNDEYWLPKIEWDENFGSDVLNVYTELWNGESGVKFVIQDVLPENWETIAANIHVIKNRNAILDESSEAGRIYVGGLFVQTAKGFKHGYTFTPSTIKLDRDRGMVDGFDLSYETSRLWTDEGDNRVVKLLEDEAPDVRYVESHADSVSPAATHTYRHFLSNYGSNAVPVTSQAEIEQANAAGIKWVLVKQPVKALLRMVRSWFIPSNKTPLERLKEFKSKHAWRLGNDGQADLDDIITSMEVK